MEMKVVGTGAPRMLTVRLKSCEVKIVQEELRGRRAAVTAEAAEAQARAGARPGHDSEVEDRHDELILISRLLDDLRTPLTPGQPREVVGPTWVLGPILRGAAATAAEHLRDAVAEFADDVGTPTPDELRAAVDAAAATAGTLIALDHVENYAVI